MSDEQRAAGPNPAEELVFKRSKRGHYNKYQEAIKLLEYSIILVEFFQLKEWSATIKMQSKYILV
ncbi:hypothetical protein [Cohnella soli]|uniref:Uncharacterized protein n=1 Tax=Cohnella soli TaxID=425005 RepID=A0ABW0I1A1_9BACL